MITRAYWGILLSCLALFLSGCPETPGNPPDPTPGDSDEWHFPNDEIVQEEEPDWEQVPFAAIEQEIVALTNAERVAAGLPELDYDSILSAAIRAHSEDMAENNYFSHINLEGDTARERLRDAGIPWRAFGENLYYIYGHPEEKVAEIAVQGWMDSPGHRAIIISDLYTHLGVGVARDASGAYYITQTLVLY